MKLTLFLLLILYGYCDEGEVCSNNNDNERNCLNQILESTDSVCCMIGTQSGNSCASFPKLFLMIGETRQTKALYREYYGYFTDGEDISFGNENITKILIVK